MVTNRKPTGRAAGFPKGLALGALAALSTTLALAAVLAALISSGTVAEDNLGYGVMALLFVSAALGGRVAFSLIKHRRALVFALSALCYLVSLTALTALFFGGRFDGFFPTAMLIIGGSSTSFLLSAGAGKGGKGRRKSKQIRENAQKPICSKYNLPVWDLCRNWCE